MESISRGVMDTPQEPVIGLAEGETRWRGKTVFARDHIASLTIIARHPVSPPVRPSLGRTCQPVGWGERSETHRPASRKKR